MITVRPAVAADVDGIHPEFAGISYRAWAADLDGKAVGVIGLALTRPRACLFCGFKPELRPYLASMPILRLLKKVETMFKERGLPVFTLRDRNEPKAPMILKRLGFEYAGEIDGDEIHVWSPE